MLEYKCCHFILIETHLKHILNVNPFNLIGWWHLISFFLVQNLYKFEKNETNKCYLVLRNNITQLNHIEIFHGIWNFQWFQQNKSANNIN